MGISLLGMTQTATDFTAEDCSGNSYNLFSDLDSGKVVAIVWTMPCGACISGALTTYNIVQSYEANYPDKVKMLVVDDFGNTPCTSINSWTNQNGLTRTTRFSNSAIAMSDYGIAGMPKVVVVGGTDHAVYYNVNHVVDPIALQDAINAALTTTAVKEVATTISSFEVNPNPATQTAQIKFTLQKNADIVLQLFNSEGQLVQDLYQGRCSKGENEIAIDVAGYSSGSYFVNINDGNKSHMIYLIVNH